MSRVKLRKRSYEVPARILRSARKRLGLTQVEVAKQLQVSQSLLSKYEAGALLPDMYQWTEFCNLTRIPMDSHVSGMIDNASIIQLTDQPRRIGSFRLPEKYGFSSASKVRTTLPFLTYFEAQFGAAKLEKYIESVGMDSDFFTSLDLQLNMNFSLDISRTLIRKGVLKSSDLKTLSQFVSTPAAHGALGRQYDSMTSHLSLVQAFIGNLNKYESNCEYKLEDCGPTHADLSSKYEPHTKDFQYNDDILGDFPCRYKKQYLTQFTTYKGRGPAVVKEKECTFHGGTRCVYTLEFSA